MDLRKQSKIAQEVKTEILQWAKRKEIDLCCIHRIGPNLESHPRMHVLIFYDAERDVGRYAQDGTSERLKHRFIRMLRDRGYLNNLIPKVTFEFDSDENVQNNYEGSYFYRLR